MVGTEEEGGAYSLVDAGLGVGDLVERGHLEPVGIAPLALVHVVPEGQHHLQQLLQVPAVQHLPGGLGEGWGRSTGGRRTPSVGRTAAEVVGNVVSVFCTSIRDDSFSTVSGLNGAE